METYDAFGRPTSVVHFVTLCPVKYLVRGRELAFRHLQTVEQVSNDELERILPLALSPRGEGPPTHFYCGRWVSRGFVDLQLAEMQRLHGTGLEWMAERLYTLEDDPELIRSRFCCLIAPAVDVMSLLGIQEPIRPVGIALG